MDRDRLLALCDLLDIDNPEVRAAGGRREAEALVVRERLARVARDALVDADGRWIDRWDGVEPVGRALGEVLASDVDRDALTRLVRALQRWAVSGVLRAIDDGRVFARGAEPLSWALCAPAASSVPHVEGLAEAFEALLRREDPPPPDDPSAP